MSCIEENRFIARIESLMMELAGASEADEDLRARSHEALMEGYGRALALEGRRRRLRERQLALAELPETDALALDELAGLARCEARLCQVEGKLRSMLVALRERERG